jgi:hypothetical protein
MVSMSVKEQEHDNVELCSIVSVKTYIAYRDNQRPVCNKLVMYL